MFERKKHGDFPIKQSTEGGRLATTSHPIVHGRTSEEEEQQEQELSERGA